MSDEVFADITEACVIRVARQTLPWSDGQPQPYRTIAQRNAIYVSNLATACEENGYTVTAYMRKVKTLLDQLEIKP